MEVVRHERLEAEDGIVGVCQDLVTREGYAHCLFVLVGWSALVLRQREGSACPRARPSPRKARKLAVEPSDQRADRLEWSRRAYELTWRRLRRSRRSSLGLTGAGTGSFGGVIVGDRTGRDECLGERSALLEEESWIKMREFCRHWSACGALRARNKR